MLGGVQMGLKEELYGVVVEKTGWGLKKILEEKDIGDIEEKLGIKPKPPRGLEGLKLGYPLESRLYKFVSEEERLKVKKTVDNLLKE
jgi:hypothetical protein